MLHLFATSLYLSFNQQYHGRPGFSPLLWNQFWTPGHLEMFKKERQPLPTIWRYCPGFRSHSQCYAAMGNPLPRAKKQSSERTMESESVMLPAVAHSNSWYSSIHATIVTAYGSAEGRKNKTKLWTKDLTKRIHPFQRRRCSAYSSQVFIIKALF